MSTTDALTATLSAAASAITTVATATASSTDAKKNSTDKVIGVCLALGSGVLIGTSFVVKKKGLIAATAKAGNVAGEGHAYLKNWLWWVGMSMMIVGEICNFVAFAFTEALLITPLGAITIVVCAVLSKFFLNESLTFFGWMGCILCILGATILALNAPETQSVTTVTQLQKVWVSPAGVCLIASAVLAFYFGPRYGKKNMFVYITICSLIGGLSVSTLQGVGASILTSIRGDNQFKHWFLYVVTAFTVVTLLTEPSNCSTPRWILYQGLKTSAVSLITMVLGFLVTCFGITVLQMSKVDPKHFNQLDRRSTMLLEASRSPTEEAEKHEISAIEEPGMDALRGGFGTIGSILRARSVTRMNSMSSTQGGGLPFSNSGRDGIPRYQLSDAPIHDDTAEEIALKSMSMSFQPFAPRSRNPTLKFDDQDVVHQYDRTGHEDAIHTARMHASDGHIEYGESRRTASDAHHIPLKSPHADKTGGHSFFAARPFKSFRRRVSVQSEEDELANVPLTPATPHGILDTHTTTIHLPSRGTSPMDTTNSRASFNTLLNKFVATEGPDLRLNPGRRGSKETDDMKRGGAHRGTKDYPHLKKSAAEQELEERRGLVGDADQSFGVDEEERDERVSSPLSMTSVERAEVLGAAVTRRLPNIPTSGENRDVNVSGYPPSRPRDSGDIV
ncbi:hypothetical protein QFC21_004611 [Naganishia friedmannii]|uniref:Uncharacterized protein n=1 Tax=Naganishia friedmannii TaxID=89922 RepID=A0ACC2VI89_9TREE|nr:hypothetical protein QFC21_004611 [Naganishia friedmannii]